MLNTEFTYVSDPLKKGACLQGITTGFYSSHTTWIRIADETTESAGVAFVKEANIMN